MNPTIAGSLNGNSCSTVVWGNLAPAATWEYKFSKPGVLVDSNNEGYMELYEYSVVYTGDEDYKGAKVLIAPTAVLAFDEAGVRMIAARAIPLEYDDRLDDITIYVRLWQA